MKLDFTGWLKIASPSNCFDLKPLQNKRGQKRGNCGFPRKCHELHVLHGSDFIESVDTCENHVFHVPWITRKRVETVDWCPLNCGKLGKPV